ncbi:MAG: type II toxin-antitoxin system VapC family toxin [Vicinamibacterales bacterium]
MKVLLDTNAYAALMRGHAGVAESVRGAERVYLPAIVAGELLFGFRHGTRYEQNRAELNAFLDSPYVTFVPVSLTTADRFSRIATTLRKKGTPLPTNDVWIAAHAMETGADLLSFDAHFEQIEGLVFVRP